MIGFSQWYNDEHRHSGIKFVTPSDRHQGLDNAISLNRVAVYTHDTSRCKVSKANCAEMLGIKLKYSYST